MGKCTVDEGGAGGAVAGVFDEGVLRGLVGDDLALRLEILACFDGVATGTRDALLRAARAGDAGEASMLGHSLKSAARSVGALRLGTFCARLEAEAQSPQGEGLGPLVEQVVDALDAALAAMRAWRSARGAPMEKECGP